MNEISILFKSSLILFLHFNFFISDAFINKMLENILWIFLFHNSHNVILLSLKLYSYKNISWINISEIISLVEQAILRKCKYCTFHHYLIIVMDSKFCK